MSRTFWRSLIFALIASLVVLVPVWFAWRLWNQEQRGQLELGFLSEGVKPEIALSVLAQSRTKFDRLPDGLWLFSESGVPTDSYTGRRFPLAARAVVWPQQMGQSVEFHEAERDLHGLIFRVNGERTRYIAVIYRNRWILSDFPYLIGGLFSLILSTMMSVGMALSYLRAKGRHAENVMHRLRAGELGARLELNGVDELGQFGAKFNRMAEEIESLVRRLEGADKSRVQVVEELAHDLRTPLTSILTVFESISDADASSLSPEFIRDCAQLALPEIDYVNRLIYDLFLVAQVAEPGYKPTFAGFDLRELVHAEIRHFSGLGPVTGGTVRFEHDLQGLLDSEIEADSHLMKRLLRNLLANASRMAKSRVLVTAKRATNGDLKLSVEDDGPGFRPEMILSFGENRPSLKGKTTMESSLKLGAVIMKTIVDLHEGELETTNAVDAAGVAIGAKVLVTVPRRRAAA